MAWHKPVVLVGHVDRSWLACAGAPVINQAAVCMQLGCP